MSDLSLKNIQVNKSSYVDPNGFLFSYQSSLLRAIKPKVESFYQDLIDKGVVDKLISEYGLIETEKTQYKIPEIDCNLVLKHRTVKPLSYCVEWPPSMLRDAALLTLDLNIALLDYDCMLQDAYPWNVLFDSSQPVFVDFTSIVPLDNTLLWPAYQQFMNFFITPLELMARGKEKIARALLFNYIDGISPQEFARNLSWMNIFRRPLETIVYKAGPMIEESLSKTSFKKEMLKHSKNMMASEQTSRVRRQFLTRLRKRVQNFKFKRLSSRWKKYYEKNTEQKQDDNIQEKIKIVGDLLNKSNVKTLIDIGCNTGKYSLLAADKNIEVIALDSDEACVDMLYKAASDDKPVLPLVMDILNPTPAYGFLASQFPSAIERLQCDMVLALAVVHHMHISGRQSLDNIAMLFQKLAKKAIVEYVAMDDDKADVMSAGREIDYTLESFCESFKKAFGKVQVYPSNLKTRKILVCG